MTDKLNAASPIDWSRYRLTRPRVFGLCAALLAVVVTVSAAQYGRARDLVLPAGTPVGGDYIAFYGAADLARDGRAAAAYSEPTFQAHLKEIGPPLKRFRLTWQYPPTYFFIIAPLAFLPFLVGYILWTAGTAAFFFETLRRTGFDSLFLFAVLAAPSTFHAVITGQNGFLTAGLLAIAALYPDRRPILAGAAAALLTVKPQLGVLLPIAYMAGGCWRAFFTAAAASLALAGLATVAYGPDIWTAFMGGATLVSDRLAAGVMPLFKMMTPFAWVRHMGAPQALAWAVHGACALAAMGAVALSWARLRDAELRAAILCAGVFFVAPYAYYYEAVILALPVGIIARRGLRDGWLKGEDALVAVMVILPMALPGARSAVGVSMGFPCAALVAVCVMRRVLHADPTIFAHAISGRK